MHGDENYSKFFVYLNLFAFSMLMLVLGNNLLITFLGWEGVGACSYFLISFWFTDPVKASAGKKAFVTNRIGDWGFMVAIFACFAALGSVNYTEILGGAGGLSETTATLIAVLPVHRRLRQVGPVPALRLAARRHGRPHAGLRAHPRRHHGDLGRLPAHPGQPDHRRGRDLGAAPPSPGSAPSPPSSPPPSPSASATSSGCWRTPPSASSATCSSPSAPAPTWPPSST